MSWFANICRNMGLMVHNVKHPHSETQRKIVKQETQVEQRGNVTLRRTTIEEIVIRPEDKK